MHLARTKREKSRATIGLVAATGTMFALASAHYVVVAHSTMKVFTDNLPVTSVREGPIEIMSYCFECINVRAMEQYDMCGNAYIRASIQCFIGDGIVIWRVWIVWYRRKAMIAVPVVLWIATLGERY